MGVYAVLNAAVYAGGNHRMMRVRQGQLPGVSMAYVALLRHVEGAFIVPTYVLRRRVHRVKDFVRSCAT